MHLRLLTAALAVVSITACQSPATPGPFGLAGGSAGAGVVGAATEGTTGGGKYLLLNTIDADFDFNAVATGRGGAEGHFFQSFVFQNELIEFRGRVTCVSVDPANGRAWIGGIVTVNNSTHAQFTTPRTQPGRDVWFRVLDTGEGGERPPDRTTIFGFEGDRGIITSAEYCAAQLWVDNDAATHPVSHGNIQVRP
jgi:hypothetical protein